MVLIGAFSRKNGIMPHNNYIIIAAFVPGRKHFLYFDSIDAFLNKSKNE